MQSKRTFWSYYISLILHPSKTFDALLQDDRRVSFGFLAVLIPAIGYTLFYILASMAGGAPSTFKPWLAIPIEEYFFYDIFIVAPSMLLCWIFSSGFVQLTSRLFSGRGTFEDTVSVIGFGISIATWSTLIHDLTDAFLSAVGVINLREYEAALNGPTVWRTLLLTLFVIYFVWFLILFTSGIKSAQSVARWKAFILAILGLVAYQGVFLIFNR